MDTHEHCLILLLRDQDPKLPVILFGYNERDCGGEGGIAAQGGIDFEKIGHRLGAGGAPVEIWAGYAECMLTCRICAI